MSEKINKKGKKRPAKRVAEGSDVEMSVSDGADSDAEMEIADHVTDINVEFEAFTPEENDFHGIKQLLLRTFVMLHVDVSDMSDLIISQKSIGSTIKIVDDDEDGVYGIVTLLHLKKYESKPCIKDLKKNLLGKCKCKETAKKLEYIFNNKQVGFLVNERFINLPDEIAIPFQNSVKEEMDGLIKQDGSFDIDYLMLVAKTMQPTKSVPMKEGATSQKSTTGGKKQKTKHKAMLRNEDEVDYTNFEDEIYFKASELSFSYCVTQATGFAVAGGWDFVDQPMNTYRTVYLLPKNKWKDVLSEINSMGS